MPPQGSGGPGPRVGLVVFPIGQDDAARRNCSTTIVRGLDYEWIARKASQAGVGQETLSLIQRVVGRQKFIAWGAREGSFRNNKKVLQAVVRLVNETQALGVPREPWVAMFYRLGKIVCPGWILGVLDSEALSSLLWGSREWRYVFLIKPLHDCGEALEPVTCKPREGPGVYDASLILQGLVGFRKPFMRTLVARILEGEKAGRLWAILGNTTPPTGGHGEAAGQGTEASGKAGEEGTCRFLERILGEGRLEGLVSAVKALLEIRGAALLYGPPGVGKTSLARCVAERMGATLVSVTGHMWLSRHTLVGGCILSGGSTRWEPGVIVRAAREATRDRPVVVLLDEVNRAEPERVLGEVFTALASPDRILEIPDAPEDEGRIPLENVYLIATANSVDSVALARMGVALHRRFPAVRVELSPEELGRVEENMRSLLREELGGDDCAERIIDASIAMWEIVYSKAVDAKRTHIAPGWSYAIDSARLLARILQGGCGDPGRVEGACRLVAEAWYSEYLRLARIDASTDDLVQRCKAELLGEGGSGG